ncbi:MAG TPA: hypothetical protein VEO96_07305 [Thermoplasmata archaeon]|nr:hypothetical protein [Thermoplasmata archaeon]
MDGRQHFDLVKAAIPPCYASVVSGEHYVRNGRVYERLLESILRVALPDEEITHPPPLITVPREAGGGGYLQPDLQIGDRTFVEVTAWADSNMVFSKIMQGLLVKRRVPFARYFVVVADLGLDAGWSYDDERLWEDWGQVGGVKAVDGWYGFANVEALVAAIKQGVQSFRGPGAG